jgi:hypothetical protein
MGVLVSTVAITMDVDTMDAVFTGDLASVTANAALKGAGASSTVGSEVALEVSTTAVVFTERVLAAAASTAVGVPTAADTGNFSEFRN